MGREKTAGRYFALIQSINGFVVRLKMAYSRLEAHKTRREVVKRNGKKVVNRQVLRSIKEYSRNRFGSKAYWPHLALYTEVRGKFIEGWLPDDYFRYVLAPQISSNPPIHMSWYKSFDYQLFGDFALKPLAVFISGVFLDPDFESLEKAQVKNLLDDYNDVIVIKEDQGLQGKQIQIIHSSEFDMESLKPGRSYVIQPYVKQYKAINDVYPDSVNTMRVGTFIQKDGSVEVKFASLRFGVDGSKVDNVSSGGQFINYDADGKPSKNAFGKAGLVTGERHKNSGYLFADLELPMFHDILEACRKAHRKCPYDRFVGWDVCIDESGKPILLEWNVNPHFRDYEMLLGPLFPNDDIV